MRRSTTRPIRLAVALAAGGALALTACGDDDGSGDGGVEAFCEELETFSASVDESEGDDTFLADFGQLADAAPSEISDEMNQMLEAFEELDAFPDEPESEEQMTEMMELLDAIEEPADAVEEFAVANCPDLPASIFGG
jgi:hypothetical protein